MIDGLICCLISLDNWQWQRTHPKNRKFFLYGFEKKENATHISSTDISVKQTTLGSDRVCHTTLD